ncbi:imm11 family protein [Pendulispora albinea]|uniref:Uncharacterized protein n=1 Tax=Pendulispora albinea TaxID=2741071 RepID=A0ABZ2M9L3_9BACT
MDESDFDLLRFNGRPRAEDWRPVNMTRLKVWDDGRRLKPSDFPSCSGGDMMILSQNAKEVLGSYLAQYGELLPLACNDGEFWTLNVTTFVDALDEEATQAVRASDSGRILLIRKHAFNSAALRDAGLFKLPQTPRGLIYATESFAQELRRHSLLGLELEPIWAPN